MQKLILCDDSDGLTVAPLALANGLGVEIQTFRNPSSLMRQRHLVPTHLGALSGIALRSIHGPGYEPSAEVCLGSADAQNRTATRRNFDLAISLAKELACTHVILHHGYIPGQSSEIDWLSRATAFLQDFAPSVPESISIHIENALEKDPGLLSEVVAAVGKPNLDICLDIGHAHCRSTIPLVDWIEQLGKQIGYVHLHDNHGIVDEHLALGQGSIPMNTVCQALCECAPRAIWAIESNVPVIGQSIDWLRRNGFITH